MKRLLVAVCAALILCGPAQAARHDNFPLHVGSAGPNCALAKYLERVPRPKQNVFTQIKGTYARKNGMGGFCNKALAAATVDYKWRLGYPKKWVKPVVGRYFIDLLTGKRKRPVDWVRVAAQRLKAIEAAQPSRFAAQWKALLQSWLGIREVPVGSNRGPCISYACTVAGRTFTIQASTGAYGAAWCVSTQQAAAALVGYGHFANDTASVYYAVDYANARGWLSAKAKVGSLVAFITYDRYGHRVPGTGHMGFVMAVQSRSFTYAAGNDHQGVNEHTIPFGSRPYVFIRLPSVA
jgi:hypothetical protein